MCTCLYAYIYKNVDKYVCIYVLLGRTFGNLADGIIALGESYATLHPTYML